MLAISPTKAGAAEKLLGMEDFRNFVAMYGKKTAAPAVFTLQKYILKHGTRLLFCHLCGNKV